MKKWGLGLCLGLVWFGIGDIFNLIDTLWVSKYFRIYLGPLLNQYHSKPNPNRGWNPIFSPQNFTESEISSISNCSGFQALHFLNMWPKCTRNLLTDPLNSSVNWVFASGHLWPISQPSLKKVKWVGSGRPNLVLAPGSGLWASVRARELGLDWT